MQVLRENCTKMRKRGKQKGNKEIHVCNKGSRAMQTKRERACTDSPSSHLRMPFDLHLPLAVALLHDPQEVERIQQIIDPPQPTRRLPSVAPAPLPPREMDLLPVLLVKAIVPEVGLHDRALQLEVDLGEEVRDGDDRAGYGGDVDHPGEEGMCDEHAVCWRVCGGFLEFEVGVRSAVGLDLERFWWHADVPYTFGRGGVVVDRPMWLCLTEHRLDIPRKTRSAW